MNWILLRPAHICLISILASTCASAGEFCEYISRNHYVDGWTEVSSKEGINSQITPEGVVKCAFFPDQGEKLNVLVRQEHGLYQGIGYRIFYTDGSGVIQGEAGKPLDVADYQDNWKLKCRANLSEELKRCVLRKGDLFIIRYLDGSYMVDVGSDKKSGSEMQIRVDDNQAFTVNEQHGFTDEQAGLILEQMKTGRKLYTRYTGVSNQRETEKTINLFAYSRATDIVELVAFEIFTVSKISADQVRQVIKAADLAADNRDADGIGIYLSKSFFKYIDVPTVNPPVTARIDKDQYLEMIKQGWKTVEDYRYQRKDVVINVALDGASAESNSTIVETVSMNGQDMVSKVREYARYRMEYGKPVITRIETQTLVGDTTPE